MTVVSHLMNFRAETESTVRLGSKSVYSSLLLIAIGNGDTSRPAAMYSRAKKVSAIVTPAPAAEAARHREVSLNVVSRLGKASSARQALATDAKDRRLNHAGDANAQPAHDHADYNAAE